LSQGLIEGNEGEVTQVSKGKVNKGSIRDEEGMHTVKGVKNGSGWVRDWKEVSTGKG
jgi:hypothetical protein